MTPPPSFSCQCCREHLTLVRHELGESSQCFQGMYMAHLSTWDFSLFAGFGEVGRRLVDPLCSVKPFKTIINVILPGHLIYTHTYGCLLISDYYAIADFKSWGNWHTVLTDKTVNSTATRNVEIQMKNYDKTTLLFHASAVSMVR